MTMVMHGQHGGDKIDGVCTFVYSLYGAACFVGFLVRLKVKQKCGQGKVKKEGRKDRGTSWNFRLDTHTYTQPYIHLTPMYLWYSPGTVEYARFLPLRELSPSRSD